MHAPYVSPANGALQQPLGQSVLVMQVFAQADGPEAKLAQTLPVQHSGSVTPPHAVPSAVQEQYFAAAQNPPGEEANFWQHPVSQSAFALQSARQPANSGLTEVMQFPLQQTLVFGSGVHALPRFTQGVWHALAAAQTVCPVSCRSVQHPVSQSEL